MGISPKAMFLIRNYSMVRDLVKKLHFGLNCFTVGLLSNGSFCYGLVDNRLGGDGTGKPFGISDPKLALVVLFVFTFIWSIFFSAIEDLGCKFDEDGLSL